jgi:hypothetical protein
MQLAIEQSVAQWQQMSSSLVKNYQKVSIAPWPCLAQMKHETWPKTTVHIPNLMKPNTETPHYNY